MSTSSPAPKPDAVEIRACDEHHAAVAAHAAVAIVQAVDRGVVLVVRAHRHQLERARPGSPRHRRSSGMRDGTVARPARGREHRARAPGWRRWKPPGSRTRSLKSSKPGITRGDAVADAVVVARPARRHGVRLRGSVAAASRATIAGSDSRCVDAGAFMPARQVHHAHRILDRHGLRAAGLHVDLGAAQAGQDQRLAPVHQVRAVELGGDVHGQRRSGAAPAPVRVGVGRGGGEVAAQREEHLRACPSRIASIAPTVS